MRDRLTFPMSSNTPNKAQGSQISRSSYLFYLVLRVLSRHSCFFGAKLRGSTKRLDGSQTGAKPRKDPILASFLLFFLASPGCWRAVSRLVWTNLPFLFFPLKPQSCEKSTLPYMLYRSSEAKFHFGPAPSPCIGRGDVPASPELPWRSDCWKGRTPCL